MTEKLSFIQPGEIRKKRSKGQRYAAYAEGLAEHLDDIKKGIEASLEDRVIVDTNELAELMGMEGKDPKSIYWGVKFVLWTEGIAVGTATRTDGSHLLVFREPRPGEKLPASMLKYDTSVEDDLNV